MRVQYRVFALGLLSIFLVHCAKGAQLSDSGAGAGSGEGGDGGDETTTGQGGNPNGSGGATTSHDTTGGAGGETTSTTSSSSSSSSSTTSSSSTSSTTSSSSTSSTTSSSSSSSTTSSSTTSSSSSGADCNPLNPGLVCAATEHCFPQPDGNPVCAGPVGSGGKYSGCLDASECQAPFNCIDVGDIFLLPCCLSWCTSAADCGAAETCEYLATPVYVGGVEYGVCYDGFGGC